MKHQAGGGREGQEAPLAVRFQYARGGHFGPYASNLKAGARAVLYWGCTATRRGARWITNRGQPRRPHNSDAQPRPTPCRGLQCAPPGPGHRAPHRPKSPGAPEPQGPKRHGQPSTRTCMQMQPASQRSHTPRYMLCQQTRWQHKKRSRRKELHRRRDNTQRERH